MAKKQRTLQERIKAAAVNGRCPVRAVKITMDEGKLRQIGDGWPMLTQLVGPHVDAGIVELLD